MMSHSSIKQLKARLDRSVKEVKSNIADFKAKSLNKLYGNRHKANYDEYYKTLEKEYNDEPVFYCSNCFNASGLDCLR